MLLDPTGFRWLNETWLKVDRGVDFYNRAAGSGGDLSFWLNRATIVALGLGAVLPQRSWRFARRPARRPRDRAAAAGM